MRHRTVAQANERGGDNGETTPQVRRIDELERQVDELSRELRKLSAPHGDAGSDPMGASGETRA